MSLSNCLLLYLEIQLIFFSYVKINCTRVPFPNKISCFVSACVSSDNSFLSVRQEPSFGPWKGSPFLQQLVEMGMCM